MILNLGCGANIRPEAVNVDSVPLPGVDVIHDLDDAPWPWEDRSIDCIVASHVFEHVKEPVLFMAEAWRVLVSGGLLDIRVPYYKHIHAFTDPTHRRFCTELTWMYWIPGQPLHHQFGAAFGSPPVRFALEEMRLNGAEQEELQVTLTVLTGDGT